MPRLENDALDLLLLYDERLTLDGVADGVTLLLLLYDDERLTLDGVADGVMLPFPKLEFSFMLVGAEEGMTLPKFTGGAFSLT